MPRFFKVQSSECKVQLLSAPTARTAFPLSSRAFLFVIAREHCDRGDPVIIKSHAFACVHYLLDCFAALRMTNMMKYILPVPRGQKAPHKNIRFCGDPAPRGDKEESPRMTHCDMHKTSIYDFSLARFCANQ